ncbi:MAG: Ig-like domain-containing protein [Patescibacteria group bacterium]
MVKIYIAAILLVFGAFIYSNAIYSPVFAKSQTFNISVSVTISPTTLVFQGFTSPNALVYVEENNTVVGTSTADSSGNFIVTLVGISSGISNYQIYSQDINGINSNVVSISDNIMSDRTNNIYNINLSPTLVTKTNNNIFYLNGRAYPSSKIEIFLNSNYAYSITVNSSGNFEYIGNASNLALGKYTITALDITNTGVISNYSNPVTIDITNTTSPNPNILKKLNSNQSTNTSHQVIKTPTIHTVHVVKNSTLNYCSFNYCNGRVIPATISKKVKPKTDTVTIFVISFSLLILIAIILRRLL